MGLQSWGTGRGKAESAPPGSGANSLRQTGGDMNKNPPMDVVFIGGVVTTSRGLYTGDARPVGKVRHHDPPLTQVFACS
jgi:hypothetical protein